MTETTKSIRMKPSLNSSASVETVVRSFDIGDAEFSVDGVIDFYWPLDNKKSSEVMNSVTSKLIPYITQNEEKFPELLAVRLLFKWFVCEVLRLLEATILAAECKKDSITPIIPKHYKKLHAVYNSNNLECIFFLNQSSGPSYGRNIPRTLKRFGKEFLWNGLQGGLFRKYGSNMNDVLAIGPSKLAIQHAKGANKLLRYSAFDEWFSSIPQNLILKDSEELVGLPSILDIVQDSFSAAGYEISPESVRYLSTWVNQAKNFVNYHIHKGNDLLNKIRGDVWFGCGGSSVWHVMLIEKLRRKGIKVVTHDHGAGTAHHEQTPVHWVEYMHTDHFVTFNKINEKIRNGQFNSKLIFGQSNPIIQSLDSVLGNKSTEIGSRIIKTSNRIKKIMYVGAAFHGEGARLRPIFHDMTYFDWQIKLLSHLKKLNMDVIYKPHPEGATGVPANFAESFDFRSTTERLESIEEDVDAYVIDFVFSTTTPIVLRSNKPVFFINLGFPELLPEALDLIKKRCYYLEAEYTIDSRLNVDFDQFDRFMNEKEHIFDAHFSDLYFNNL